MDDLPSPLLLDILARLADSTELARCRLASKTLRSLSYDVRSVTLLCSHDRFLRSRAPATRDLTVPFKTLVFNNLSLLSGALRSLSIGIEKPFAANSREDDDFDDSDDLHLTSVDFVSRWLQIVGEGLRSISISDYWIQSCWRRSEALALISDCCVGLEDLVVRNSWLSVEGMKLMPKLTTLTLEFIRLDDEDLDKVNECFPSLQVLNLIGVGGLKEPRICFSQLRTCQWTVSNFPLSLTIDAPNLIDLKLKCVEPNALFLDAPRLSNFDFKIKRPGKIIKFGRFPHLKTVRLESSYLSSLVPVFMCNQTVKKLELEAPENVELDQKLKTLNIMDVVSAFPSMDDLKLGPGAWVQLERSFTCRGVGTTCEWRNLKKLTVHLPPLDFNMAFLSFILNLCTPFCKVTLLLHGHACAATREHIISRCTSTFTKVIWKWGAWNPMKTDS